MIAAESHDSGHGMKIRLRQRSLIRINHRHSGHHRRLRHLLHHRRHLLEILGRHRQRRQISGRRHKHRRRRPRLRRSSSRRRLRRRLRRKLKRRLRPRLRRRRSRDSKMLWLQLSQLQQHVLAIQEVHQVTLPQDCRLSSVSRLRLSRRRHSRSRLSSRPSNNKLGSNHSSQAAEMLRHKHRHNRRRHRHRHRCSSSCSNSS
mmetsp:Transcript_57798/g.102620  ORF Transcript_57798/g.102620 Transcript_57798/m.102620 type:complete len:202 (+) Transcript_57798:1686-2291(+)